jgi:regulator of telomere elongation helicase 1
MRRVVKSLNENHAALGVGGSIVGAMEATEKFVRTLYPNDLRDDGQIEGHYGVCLTADRTLHLLCFSPAIGLEHLMRQQPHCVVFTSGTIAPMQSFMESLKIRFDIVLENPHVASPSQLLVVIASGWHERFEFTYRNRGHSAMKADFSRCLCSLFGLVPSGVLVFFGSFTALEDISRDVSGSGKRIIVEPRDRRLVKRSLEDFKNSAQQGAALFAVCRGKMSEGIDFADDFARCVCVVGVPFPNIGDFKVELHRTWLERKCQGSGSRWYAEAAMRNDRRIENGCKEK